METAINDNVKLVATNLTKQSSVLKHFVKEGKVKIVAAKYDLDQEIECRSFIKAMISPGHGLRLGRLLHLTPVVRTFLWRVVTDFTIRPKNSAIGCTDFGVSVMLPSSSKKCRKSVIQAIYKMSSFDIVDLNPPKDPGALFKTTF